MKYINYIFIFIGFIFLSGFSAGVFGMDLTGEDTGSVHTNLFAPYNAPDTRLGAESADPFMAFSSFCCPPMLVGFSTLGRPVNITVVNFPIATVYPDRNGLWIWQVPDWMQEHTDQIMAS